MEEEAERLEEPEDEEGCEQLSSSCSSREYAAAMAIHKSSAQIKVN